MTGPSEERRIMKRNKEWSDMLGFVADAQHGIPTKCPYGRRIVDEVAKNEAFDTLPGNKFFTCREYKADGLHFRQPWVFGVEEELVVLNKRMEEAEQSIKEVWHLKYQNQRLKEQVDKLTERLAELEVYL